VAHLEAAIAEARKAAAGEDLAAIKKATEDLQRAAHAIGEALYKGSSGSSGPQGPQGPQGSSGSGVKDAEVVDAEYAESV
jgi:molecular chaperone DnaK